jgi:ParB-like chromosome segregation protein Spo0J
MSNHLEASELNAIDAPISAIIVAERHREPNKKKVKQLAESMKEIGLRTPLTVEYERVDRKNPTYRLVTGHSRLQAAMLLGWETIPVSPQSFENEEERELWEIDENLMRGELSPAEEAAHLSRRKELFELIKLETGRSSPSLGGRGNKEFAADTAERTGTPKRTVNQKIARAEALGADIHEVAGTSLDKGTELDALSKMSPEARKPLIQEAKRGAPVSAVREIKSDTDVEIDQRNALLRAWNKASPSVRKWFREHIDTPIMDRGAA